MVIKFLRRLFSNDTKKVVNEKETCLGKQGQIYDDAVSRTVKKYIEQFTGLEKCKYLYFGNGIPEKRLGLARKKYADYDPSKEHPLVLIETRPFWILTCDGILLTNTCMYFSGVPDLSKGWYDAPTPSGDCIILFESLINRGWYDASCPSGDGKILFEWFTNGWPFSLEFHTNYLKVSGFEVPNECYIGTDNMRFLKGLFKSLIENGVLQKE